MNKLNNIQKLSQDFILQVKAIINNAQQNAVRSVNHERVLMYWKIDEKIVLEEQNWKQRAEYGTYLIKNLAKELTATFGKGFSERQLETCHQFYNSFPIPHTLCSELNWSQYII